MAVKEVMSRMEERERRATRRISKMGNSEGVNLPKEFRELLNLTAGDDVELILDMEKNEIVVKPQKNNRVPDGVRPEVLKALSNVLDMHGDALKKLRDR